MLWVIQIGVMGNRMLELSYSEAVRLALTEEMRRDESVVLMGEDIGVYGGGAAAIWDLDRDGYPLWWQPGPYDATTYPGEGRDCDDMDPEVYPGSGC